MSVNQANFNYYLPAELIAAAPSNPRDSCRLITLNRHTGSINQTYFYKLIDQLTENDVLVLNQSKVFPARIFGKKETGGRIELLLLRSLSDFTWTAISKPGARIDTQLIFPRNLKGKVVSRTVSTGEIDIEFNQNKNELLKTLHAIGHTPLPPYISSKEPEADLRRNYQTVFATDVGSAAAPTAGLHFTQKLLKKIKSKGIQLEYLTLHVGLGTFQPLRQENITNKKLHLEYYEIAPDVLARLNQAKSAGKRIIAVGTTSARALESASTDQGVLIRGTSATDIFIFPPYKFKFVDSLITNFHLPESSLLMLVSAFVSFPNTVFQYNDFLTSSIGQVYLKAIESKYLFFSFGDACWIY
ncbi:MAG: tRNA preQ1(34) S-adenosylmethionine ribosyltransferase-isomerase QueA [Candidatus Shapirobacteria bacterium]|jgi:S-adenosylmethionine:tRNA ribosyltransferase-isomerase